MGRSAATVRTAASILVVLLVLAGGVSPVTAGASTENAATRTIDTCTTITEPGTYVLSENTTFKGGPASVACLTIRADDVVVDGQGHVFAGHGISNTTGISVSGAENVTVKNIHVTDWHRGVSFRNAAGGTVQNASIRSNAYGLSLRDADGVTVANSATRGNLVGVRTKGDSDTTFSGFETENNRIAAAQDARTGDNRFLDRDGNLLYEDVNGDGASDYVDAFALFGLATEHTLGIGGLSDDQVRGFDFDGNDEFGYGDVFAYVG